MATRDDTIKLLKELVITGETKAEIDFGSKFKAGVRFIDGNMAAKRDTYLTRLPLELRDAYGIAVELALIVETLNGVPLQELFEPSYYDSLSDDVVRKSNSDGTLRDLKDDPLTVFEKSYAVIMSFKEVFRNLLRARVMSWWSQFLEPMFPSVKRGRPVKVKAVGQDTIDSSVDEAVSVEHPLG